ncbi:MAG: hypothetical protein KGL39_34395 [Patescibacteria group bacterium]|nr:hypothetical protein [Patescibacteria group bacterium]
MKKLLSNLRWAFLALEWGATLSVLAERYVAGVTNTIPAVVLVIVFALASILFGVWSALVVQT